MIRLNGIKGFASERLNASQADDLSTVAGAARYDVLRMISRAGSGHVGGSLSSLDIYLMVLCGMNHDAGDKIIVSHGHTAAGFYAALGRSGFFRPDDAIAYFRRDASSYEGHPSRKVPGVEWTSGSLGQGLSVACGMALASRIRNEKAKIFVVMGDGEQAKGQIQEAREFAIKYLLDNLVCIIDCNSLQASGQINEIMPQNLKEKYLSSGWNVLETDGHDFGQLYNSLHKATKQSGPVAVMAHTVMGKGVPAIENNFAYHGMVPAEELWDGLFPETERNARIYPQKIKHKRSLPVPLETRIDPGICREYTNALDCRSASGNALADIAELNRDIPLAALDCDLFESVKLQGVKAVRPESLIECGIQEHNAATVAAALSRSGILTFWADFGVFAIDEAYGQLRMADFNETSLKLICTHTGFDVGEDGKTHQCIDYISLLSNLCGFKVIIPADANQTDRAVRYAACTPGNIALCMGRSKLPTLTKENGKLFFGNDYEFEYGRMDWLRRGRDATVITCGQMAHRAVNASDKLTGEGISVGVLNTPCPLEPDASTLAEACMTGLVITYEDHNVRTGLGSIVGTLIAENAYNCRFRRIGIAAYGQSASPEYLYKQAFMDEESLRREIINQVHKN